MHVLDQQQLGVNVFRVIELEKIYNELLLEDVSSTPHMLHSLQRLKIE